jgi:hypothetical protein
MGIVLLNEQEVLLIVVNDELAHMYLAQKTGLSVRIKIIRDNMQGCRHTIWMGVPSNSAIGERLSCASEHCPTQHDRERDDGVGAGLFSALAVDCKHDADSKKGMEHKLLAGIAL